MALNIDGKPCQSSIWQLSRRIHEPLRGVVFESSLIEQERRLFDANRRYLAQLAFLESWASWEIAIRQELDF
jgi:hypothetical protein